MIQTLEQSKIDHLEALGYEGEGDLQSLIDWLGDDLVGMWQNGERTVWTAFNSFHEIESDGLTPLEAIYNLAVAIKQPKEAV